MITKLLKAVEILQRMFDLSYSKDGGGCGSGAGGFTPGNTCARGGSGMVKTKKDADGNHTMPDGSSLPGHIKKIPPAWTNVKVSKNAGSDLQVKGVDAKGRVQSVYSETHTARQAAKKFVKINKLRGKMNGISRKIRKDMKSDDSGLRDAADALSVIHRTGLRPGGLGDTKAEKKAYGAVTLEGRHIVDDGKHVRLKFTGKKGVSLDIPVREPHIVSMLKSRRDSVGADDRIFTTSPGKLRKYSQKVSGGYNPKDFRTAKGTNVAVKEMKRHAKPTSQREYQRTVKKVATVVASKLGNTPTIALQSYIDPMVFSEWRIR